MIYQTIHEQLNPFDVYVKKLGPALVRYLFPGSTSSNPQFMVRLYGKGTEKKGEGQLRVVDMIDCLEYGNPTAGEDLVPKLPEGWE